MRGRLAELDLMLGNECTCVWEAYVSFAFQDQVVEKEVPSWSLSTYFIESFLLAIFSFLEKHLGLELSYRCTLSP